MGQDVHALMTHHFAGPLGLLPDGAWKYGGVEHLNGIRNPAWRQWIIDCAAACCQDDFWQRPASNSGKYHPAVSAGPGGLVRHTLYGCYWACEIMRAMDPYPQGVDPQNRRAITWHHDVVLGAVMLHDMMKNGDATKADLPERKGSGGRNYIVSCHGVDMAHAIFTRVLNGQVGHPDHLLLLHAVAGHMGPWTKPEKWAPHALTQPDNKHVATLTFLADYCASRKADGVIADVLKLGRAPETPPLPGLPGAPQAGPARAPADAPIS